MSCPRLEDIQAYLEGGLGAETAVRVESHLADCPACREAVESRRLILRAAESLEPIHVPDDFVASVMTGLGPAEDRSLPRMTLGGWLAALSAGIFVFGSTLAALALLSGRGAGTAFARLGQGLLGYIETVAAAAGKLAILVSVFLRMAGRFIAALMALAYCAILRRRRTLILEDRHDS